MQDWIANHIFNFSDPEIFTFQVGFISGVALFATLAILLKILILLFFSYPKRIDYIEVAGTNGSLFISANAISDLVSALESDFKALEISKVAVMQDKTKDHMIRIDVIYHIGGGDFTAMGSLMQERVIAETKGIFGIDSVKHVDIRVKKSVEKKNRF